MKHGVYITFVNESQLHYMCICVALLLVQKF